MFEGLKKLGTQLGRQQKTVSTNKNVRTKSVTLSKTVFMVDDITVVFTRKRIKNINMRVKAPDGHLEVSAPPWIDEQAIEVFVRQKMSWIRQKQQGIGESPRKDMKKMSPDEVKENKITLAAAAEPLIFRWESIMGVRSKSLVYRDMTSRWGSCNPQTGRICLNIQLVNYPAECLEYVIVHELCHLLERGHGPRFKALMDRFLPDWRERKALLK